MTRSKSLAYRLFQKSFVNMEARGFAETVNWLTKSLRVVRPDGHEEQIDQLIEILVEMNGGPFHPIPIIERIESIENMIRATMPELLRSVAESFPSLSLRLQALDWRLIFGVPLAPVEFHVNAPSDDDSGTGTISESTELEPEAKSPDNEDKRLPASSSA